MYPMRPLAGFLCIALGFSLFFYAAYDLLWRVLFMLVGLFLINQGMCLRGLEPVQIAFNAWSNRFRF